MTVKGILVGNVRINITQSQLLFVTGENGLGNHGGITEGRFEVFGGVAAVVDLLSALHHHSSSVHGRHGHFAVKDYPLILASV